MPGLICPSCGKLIACPFGTESPEACHDCDEFECHICPDCQTRIMPVSPQILQERHYHEVYFQAHAG